MAKTTAKKLTGSFDLLPVSAQRVWKYKELFIILNALPLLSTLSSVFESNTTSAEISRTGIPAFGAGSAALVAITAVIYIILNSMLLGLEMSAAQNKSSSLGKLWEFARSYTFKLLGLAIVLTITILGGLILFIIPGIIFLRRYFLAPYILIDQNVGIIESMNRSAEMTRPYKGYIWSMLQVFLIIIVISGLFGILGAIAATLLSIAYSVAPALRYFELKKLGSK